MKRRNFLMGGLALAASGTLLPGLQPTAHASSAPAAGPPAAPSEVLSDMQDPRAWVLSSRDGSIRPDTSTHSHGTQSLEIATTGDSRRPTSAELALSGVDMTDCQWDLWLRAEDYRQIGSILLELGGDDEGDRDVDRRRARPEPEAEVALPQQPAHGDRHGAPIRRDVATDFAILADA